MDGGVARVHLQILKNSPELLFTTILHILREISAMIAVSIVKTICHAILASKAATQDLKKSNVTYRFKLAPAPSPFPTSQAYYNASTWSWGGSIVHVPEDLDGFQFHLFAEAEVGGCGVHAWQTNARVIHARAKTPEGPYVFSV